MKHFHSLGRLLFVTAFLAIQISGFGQSIRNGENAGGDASQKGPVSAPTDRLNFQNDLFTGRFGYQVAFPLAPGRHDSAPSLGLSYSSAGDDSICGVGWTLDFGYIQRETKRGVPVRWTNGVPVNAYDDTKGFTFSLNGKGASLVNVASNEYRAEIEGGFLRFQLLTNVNQWQVTDTSGNTYFFGITNTSRMSNSKTGWSSNAWTGTYRWALAHAETVLGDTTDYAYTNIGGTLYPLKVSYNGHTTGLTNTHTVDFVLGTRTDTRLSYVSGYRVEQSRRLDALVHKVSGQVVWSNRLNYAQSGSTLRTLLTSVTRYGTNLTSSLPPVSFDYSDQAFGFQSVSNWTNLAIPSGNSDYYNISFSGTSLATGGTLQMMDLLDMDGDGLPDRIYMPPNGPYTNLWVQRNTGSSFANAAAFGPSSVQTFTDAFNNQTTTNIPDWTAVSSASMRTLDINGDGLPDKVADPLQSYPPGYANRYTNLMVQLNNGTNWLSGNVSWTNVFPSNFPSGDPAETTYWAIESDRVKMIDMNGDGLADRLLARKYAPFTNYFVQFNTGSGFTKTNVLGFVNYGNNLSPGVYGGSINSAFVRIIDLNGDGLPDRLMLPFDNTVGGLPACANVTNYVIEFNNGYGFEAPVNWNGVVSSYTQGAPCPNNIYCNESDASSLNIQDHAERGFMDMNGDGLPDRVYRYRNCAITNLAVQINLGTNFAAPVLYGPYLSQGQGVNSDPDWTAIQGALSRFTDMNGDGLPDHVMRSYPVGGTGTYFAVELSKGPFPDLLNSVSNGIGGSVKLSYKSSTQYNNHETTNTASRNLMPFPVQTVSAISVSDGLYPSNTTSYFYEGGKWNSSRREFDGFAKATQVDPLGLTNVSWFHQAGGRDNSALGEYQDSATALGKKGSAFRTEIIGTNGLLYRLVLNKVEDASLGSGRHFAFTSQTIGLDYPGSTNAYRATAQQYFYDLSTGNLTNSIDFGEVNSVVVTSNSFSDVSGDTVYKFTTFATLSNSDILDKPQRSIVTSDSAGQSILRESFFDYDGSTGNLTQQRDRMCPTCYVTNSFGYDSYNNLTSSTDEAGIQTVTTYESTYRTFPAQQVTGNTLTNVSTYEAKSGKIISSTGPTGLVMANSYDPFFRLLETDISTTPNGAATLWIARYDYRLGMASGFSTNSVRVRKNDGVDATNGHETWTYSDGLGRTLQIRDEAEANGFRITDTVYDKRGSVQFQSLPYFSSGTNNTKAVTGLGTLTEYDPIARPNKITAAVTGTFSSGLLTGTSATSGDSGSPVGPATIAYNDGNDPWTLVVTDEETQVHKYSLDAYGRTNQVMEVASGNFTTLFKYTLAGDLTNITDNANNQIEYGYNDLGQMVAMADPDLGVWQYQRDFAGRLRKQIDANNQATVFNYDAALGRLVSRQLYDYQNNFVYGVTNVYDTSDDASFTVYRGQLYKVIDNEGYTKTGYDFRGRAVKTARYLSKNGNSYTNQFAYDDADRVTQNVYPNGGPTITNIYDVGGNLSQVKQVGGSNTVFYAAQSFNARGQLIGVSFGNSVVTTNDYFANSLRLRQFATRKTGSTNIQDLTYTYDKVSNLKSIADNVYTTNASAALSSLAYDQLHRLTALTRPATSQTATFSYDSLGNITANGENGGGAYNYGSRIPHAVKSANGRNYAYDANGNMLVRGTQRLAYDPENRLSYVVTTNNIYSMFGYDSGGSRLWKQSNGTNGLQVWIGGNYEEKNGQILFHVSAAGKTVCTFDKTGTNVFVYYHPDHLHSTAIETDVSGIRKQHYEYMAFGQDRFTESSSAFPVSRRYTSQVLDEDTGLYFYNARYYDPVLGRFIQPDSTIPIFSNPQAYNRYSYVLDNPLKYVDPTGNAPLYSYIPGIGPGIAQYQGNQQLNAMAIRLGEQRGTGWRSYNEMRQALNMGEATVGNISEIQGVAKIAGGTADVYVTAVQEIATGGISTIPSTFSRTEATVVGQTKTSAPSKLESALDTTAQVEKGTAGGGRAGKPFTPAGKREVWKSNGDANAGQNVCQNCEQNVIKPEQSKSGITPPGNEGHVDHIIPKS
jgi:RHS repeat-associated protein